MRVTELFGASRRDAPSDVEFESHGLLIRAGFVRQLASGIYTLLPLAWRSIRKIEQILREEMEAIGAQEMSMPVVHPAEIWQQSGRWQAIDETMVRFQDRAGRDMLLAMTHEEVVAELARSEISTYRHLPKLIFQLQTKFRDEPRSRGGLIRVREFVMKDSYSLDRDEAGSRQQYVKHFKAYLRIGVRTSVPLAVVQSDVGMMGGKIAHEFMYLTDIGEDTLAFCPKCGYAANREVADFKKTPHSDEAAKPLSKVHTPNATTIQEVAGLLNRQPAEIAKVVCFMAEFAESDKPRLVVCVVRGDMEVNPVRVQNLVSADGLRPAEPRELEKVGMCAGFASPIGIDRDNVSVLVDDLVTNSPNLVAGANEVDYHVENANFGRDFDADITAHIASVYDAAPCVKCETPLELRCGVEVGNIFQLGTKYTSALGALYVDQNDEKTPVVMGSYGIGVGRLLGCIAEEHRDDKGLVLPIAVAPYQVCLIALSRKDATTERAEKLYGQLQAAGLEVLFDDRNTRPGVMFADADLIGIPIRILISDRSLEKEQVELKLRSESDIEMVPLDNIIDVVQQKISEMHEQTEDQLSQIAVDAADVFPVNT